MGDEGRACAPGARPARYRKQSVRRRKPRQPRKTTVSLDALVSSVNELLDGVQKLLYDKAKANLVENTRPVTSVEEAKQVIAEKGGFIKMMWCGDLDCELKMKEDVGVSSRCMPFEQEHIGDICPVCGKPAKHLVVWGVSY